MVWVCLPADACDGCLNGIPTETPHDHHLLLYTPRRIAGLVEDMKAYEKWQARNNSLVPEESLTLIVHKDGATFKVLARFKASGRVAVWSGLDLC